MKKYRAILNNSKYSMGNILRWYFLSSTSIILLILVKYLSPLSIDATFYLFLIFTIGIIFSLNLHENKIVIIAYGLMSLGLIIYHHTTNPLQSSDAYGYYQQVFNFSSYSEYIDFFILDIKTHLFSTSSYTVFSFFYMPLYQIVDVYSPYLIVFLNILILVATIYIAKKIFFGNYIFIQNEKNERVFSYFLILIFSSASLLYYTSTFYKDLLSLFLCLLSVYLFLKKRYLILILILFISVTLRPYAIVTSMIYLIFIRDMKKSALIGVVISAAYVYSQSGTIGLINSFLNIRYLLFSPNPFSIENYYMLPLQTLESLILVVMFLISVVVFIKIKSSRYILVLGIMCIYIYSCVLTLVGFETLAARSIQYTIGTAGDSFSRKKMGILILIYFIISYVLAKITIAKARK